MDCLALSFKELLLEVLDLLLLIFSHFGEVNNLLLQLNDLLGVLALKNSNLVHKTSHLNLSLLKHISCLLFV